LFTIKAQNKSLNRSKKKNTYEMENSAVPKFTERALVIGASADNIPQDIDLETVEKYYCTKENLLGRGGFGAVYRGKHNGQDVAIKKTELNKTNYKREIEKNFLLKHPNVVSMVAYVKHLEFEQKFRYHNYPYADLCDSI